jgi:hypothetical protein
VSLLVLVVMLILHAATVAATPIKASLLLCYPRNAKVR